MAEFKERKENKDEDSFDQERSYRLKEIVDMLVVGGYFRARIAALSSFDKVVGGMAWAITASNVDADVNLVFQENSTIGQRIKISDNIVRALVKMRCPYALQSHQIQGLDFEKLFPVIQWLIKKVLETRAITGDSTRMFSVSQFSKHYAKLPVEIRPTSAKEYVHSTIESYQPKRRFRKQANSTFNSATAHVEATLLEYGQKLFSSAILGPSQSSKEEEHEAQDTRERGGSSAAAGGRGRVSSTHAALISKLEGAKGAADAGSGSGAGGAAGRSGAVPGKKTKMTAEEEAKEQARVEAEESKRFAEVQEQLAAVEGEGRVSGSQLGKIVSLQADEIRSAAQAYSEEMKKTEGELEGESVGGAGSSTRALEISHGRQMEALTKQLASVRSKQEELQSTAELLQTRVQEAQQELDQLEAYSLRLARETARLEESEQSQSAANQQTLKKLKALVALNEQLKKQEAKFKAGCKQQLQQLKEAIEKLDQENPDDAETARLREIEAIHQADSEKHAKLRQVLARKNQEISAIQRQIEDIPTRAELIQYERRFVELYQLVAEKFKETQKYFALYNTLYDTRNYMTKQVSLLESIQTGFPQAMTSPQNKQAFLESFSQILTGVERLIDKAQNDLNTEVAKLEAQSEKYNEQVEQQRNYFKMVKQFQDECFRNEKLTAMLQQASEQNQE
eukprot:TRINITY_DN11393_c0_g2_i1.p1 TRINITY_DN11393_c0_g2~~TRINITY_DN11393_c0_g2_i1.p1  ORF type:complete len:700 (-),score=250.18 TRINITY_DN11393_c0_g2_i1:113-2152(-)